MYRAIFYFNFQPVTLHRVKLLIDKIFVSSPLKIEKFGMSSGSMKGLKPNSSELLSKLTTGYPEYFFGSLFLSDKKSDCLFYLEHLPDQFFRLDITFTEKVSETKRTAFFEEFADQHDLFFGLMDSVEEYDKKHLIVTKHNVGQTEEYDGYDFFKGIPGIYEWTYFGENLTDSLKIKEVKGVKESEYGYTLNCDDSPKKESVIDLLGRDHFFDINKREKKIKIPESIEILIELFSRINRSIRPQYRCLDFIIDGVVAEQNFKKQLEFKVDDISSGVANSDDAEGFIRKIIKEATSDEWKNGLALACGYFLGKHWSKKFSKDFDISQGITFKNGDRDYILSPYNTVMLMKEDNLTIQDMEDCVGHMR